MFELVQVIARHVGIEKIHEMPIEEFFERTKRKKAEDLVADFADSFPALASQMKRAWDELDKKSKAG